MSDAPSYEAIPEGKGWLIVNLATGKATEFNSRTLTDLPFEVAEDVTQHLNKIEALLAGVLSSEIDDPNVKKATS